MQPLIIRLFSLVLLVLFTLASNAQTGPQKTSPKRPNLILKIPYQQQLQARVKEIQQKNTSALKLPKPKISTEAFKTMNNATAFIAAYSTNNPVIDPYYLSGTFRTYLRTGPFNAGVPPAADKVITPLFNETEQSAMLADKDFSKTEIIKTGLKKDLLAAWDIEFVRTGVYQISSAGAKKYLSAKSGPGGTMQIYLTADKTEGASYWEIHGSIEEGISFYNISHHFLLGKRIQNRKAILIALDYKDYSNEKLRSQVSVSWDLYYYSDRDATPNPCYVSTYIHSLRYRLSRPGNSDMDGDGIENYQCGGSDCDDNDAGRYPGNPEVCDPAGKDEDCNEQTFGLTDRDSDGFISASCYNINHSGLITAAGTDCDDNNPAIYPGQMIFIDVRTIEICNEGVYVVEEGYMAVRQPNGTAIVIPKR